MAKFHTPWSYFSFNWELYKFWGSCDLYSLTEREELFAYLCEFICVYGHDRGVVSLRNSKMLTVNSDKVQIELCSSLSLGILKDDFQMRSVLVCMKGNCVIIVCQLHYFREATNRNT